MFSAIALGIMIILIIIQVFFRYVIGQPLVATQEIVRYSMVWVVMLGSTVAIRNRSHIRVSFFVDLLPKKIKKIIVFLGYIMVVIFSLILVFNGWNLTLRAMAQMATSTKIPLGYIIVSLPICGLLSAIYTLELIFKDLFKSP